MLNRLRAKVSTLWSGLKRGWRRWTRITTALSPDASRPIEDAPPTLMHLTRTRKARSRSERKWAIAGMALGSAPLLFGVLAKLLGLPATEHVPEVMNTLAAPLFTLSCGSMLHYLIGGIIGLRNQKSKVSDVAIGEAGESLVLRPRTHDALEIIVPLEKITSALFYPHEPNPKVGTLHLSTQDDGEFELIMKTAAARKLLTDAKIGPKHRIQHLESTLTSFGATRFLGYLAMIPSLLAGIALSAPAMIWLEGVQRLLEFKAPALVNVFFFLMTLASAFALTGDLAVSLVRRLLGTSIELGAEGLRWGRSRQYLAYRDVASIDFERSRLGLPTASNFLVLESKAGKTHRIQLRSTDQNHFRLVEERLRGVLEQSAEILLPQLARGSRTLDEWKTELRRLVSVGGGYRHETVSKERVEHLLRDPAADPEQRLGAALALVEAEAPEAHRVLVSVSQGVADPELREPLEELASLAEGFAEHEV